MLLSERLQAEEIVSIAVPSNKQISLDHSKGKISREMVTPRINMEALLQHWQAGNLPNSEPAVQLFRTSAQRYTRGQKHVCTGMPVQWCYGQKMRNHLDDSNHVQKRKWKLHLYRRECYIKNILNHLISDITYLLLRWSWHMSNSNSWQDSMISLTWISFPSFSYGYKQ